MTIYGRRPALPTDKLIGNGRKLAHLTADKLYGQGCDPVMINSANPALSHNEYALVPDTISGFEGPPKGPLAGILAGLLWVRKYHPNHRQLLSVPTDAPFYPDDLPGQAGRLRALTGRRCHGELQRKAGAAFALWPVSLTEKLSKFLGTSDRLSILAFAEEQDLMLVDFSDHPASSFSTSTRQRISARQKCCSREDVRGSQQSLGPGWTSRLTVLAYRFVLFTV